MASKTSTGFDSTILGRSQLAIAHGALTNSKRPECLVKGVYPTHLTRGFGAFVWDTKGNQYIDFICGLGSSILGYANPEVNQAVMDQMTKGFTLSLGTEIEVRTAEKVKEIFPWIERVRFLKTGSDACNAATRIARAWTKDPHVESEGYHGWADEFVGLTPPAVGVPPHQYTHKLGTAPVSPTAIVEPYVTDLGKERAETLRFLRYSKRCLIFDEVITGFRFPNWSATTYSGVQPDLICLGKAIANGMPLAVVGGRKEVMECDEYFVSSTFAGETLSLAAALKTMSLLQAKHNLAYLWEKGSQFLKRFNSLWPDGVWIEGYPTRGVFRGEAINKALFWQEACRAGLLFGPSWFFNFSHIELMDSVLSTCQDILTRIRLGQVKLEGEMPQTPFAQKAREK